MTTTATYNVSGMSCQHCVDAVTAEVGRLAGVEQVAVAERLAGRKLLQKLRGQVADDQDSVRLVALQGLSCLENHREYRAYYFMAHALPYANL